MPTDGTTAWATSEDPAGASVVVGGIVDAVLADGEDVVGAGASVGREPVPPPTATAKTKTSPASALRCNMDDDATGSRGRSSGRPGCIGTSRRRRHGQRHRPRRLLNNAHIGLGVRDAVISVWLCCFDCSGGRAGLGRAGPLGWRWECSA